MYDVPLIYHLLGCCVTKTGAMNKIKTNTAFVPKVGIVPTVVSDRAYRGSVGSI